MIIMVGGSINRVEQMPKVPAAAGFMVHLSSDPSTSFVCVDGEA